MHFEEILDQAIAMLQRRGRITYRALKRQFDQEWRGRHYHAKQVEAYAVQEGADWLVITVITRYF